MTTPQPPQADNPIAGRSIRVGVYDSEAKALIAEVTLPPGSSVILGSDTGCTVPLNVGLGVDRLEIVSDAGLLHFSSGMRINLSSDDETEVKADADELATMGITSPVPVRWTRIDIRVRPTLSVMIRYVA